MIILDARERENKMTQLFKFWQVEMTILRIRLDHQPGPLQKKALLEEVNLLTKVHDEMTDMMTEIGEMKGDVKRTEGEIMTEDPLIEEVMTIHDHLLLTNVQKNPAVAKITREKKRIDPNGDGDTAMTLLQLDELKKLIGYMHPPIL